MSKGKRVIEIGLKIPDNTAYTALVALRRLGLDVTRVDRAEIRFFDDEMPLQDLLERLKADETIFNPNVHYLTVRETAQPQVGEVWIEPVDGTAATVAWRLFDERDAPVSGMTLQGAVHRLLCNPSIDRAIVSGDKG